MNTLQEAIDILTPIEQDERNTGNARIARANALKSAIDILNGTLTQQLINGELGVAVSQRDEALALVSQKDAIIAEKDALIAEKDALIAQAVK